MLVQNATMETDDDTSTQLRTLPDWLPGDPRDFCSNRGLGPHGSAVILAKYFGTVDAVSGVIPQTKLTRHELNGYVRLALTFEAFADDKFIAVAVDGVHRVIDYVLAARLRLEIAVFSKAGKDIAMHALATDGNTQQSPHRSYFATGYYYLQRVQHHVQAGEGNQTAHSSKYAAKYWVPFLENQPPAGRRKYAADNDATDC